jgi:Rho-binding antiterminator
MNDSNPPYVPINCSFYDYLEEAATLDRLSAIEYMEGNRLVKIASKIQTLVSRDKIEYMVLENGQSIRLDYLLSINGISLPKSC